ncbi:MAG: hypothetical protein OHK0036_08700 [Bacteroidia bacterium]
MKKQFFVMGLLACSILNAQTLNQNTHAPAIGDVYTFQYADPTSLPANLGNPGPGNVFNFSSLSIYAGSNTSNGVTPASTGSASTYPSANVAVQTGTNNTFYESQSNYLKFYGGAMTLGGYPVVLNYTSPATYGLYPMGLGTTNTSTVNGTINAFSNTGNFTGISSFTANATGTLNVPGASYTNVLRVQTQQNITFTISFIQGTLTVNQYDYYAPNYSNFPNANNNWPVLTVQQSTISSTIGGTSIQTTVTINGNYQTLGITNNASYSETMILPNPAKDNIKIISSNNDVQKIQIIDVNGKVIKETRNTDIDCSNLNNGTYFIRTEDKQGKVRTEKIIIQH